MYLLPILQKETIEEAFCLEFKILSVIFKKVVDFYDKSDKILEVGTNRNANVAQLVEQLIRNQQVSGSSPLVGSIPGCSAAW